MSQLKFHFDRDDNSTGQNAPLFPPEPGMENDSDDFWTGFDAKKSIDELFQLVGAYRTGPEYFELLKFIKRFRFYSPYNAMLVYAQRPGATYVAPPHRWMNDYGRSVRPGAVPIVILQPMGPIMFVFDVSDTEPLPGSMDLPKSVVEPFEPGGNIVGTELEMTIENAARDGVRISGTTLGSQQAGSIQSAQSGGSLQVKTKRRKPVEFASVKLRYELLINAKHSRSSRYSTIAHELGHLYCGHIGTPNKKWWPGRNGLAIHQMEFEAESVSYLVCQRLGINTSSEEYLFEYAKIGKEIPVISVETVLKAAGLIEKMGREYLPLRKET